METTATKQKKENGLKRNEGGLRDHWDNIKSINVHIIGVPEGEEREKGAEKLYEEIKAENFPNLERKQTPRSRKCRLPDKMNPTRSTPKHIPIKMSKLKTKREF